MQNYSLIQWALFLYVYSFFGWIWESCYVSIRKKQWINRGFLNGPMLPIYGSGAVMMLVVSAPFQEHLLLVYLSGVAGATALEYVTGWMMEKLFKVKYWDYSNQKIQFRGYICLSSSIAWGFFTIFLTRVLHPPVEKFVLQYLSGVIGIIFACVVSVFFVVDVILSAKEAFDMTKALEAMNKVWAELESAQVQLALLKAQTSDYVQDEFGEVIERVDSLKIKAQNVWEEQKEQMEEWKEKARLATEENSENIRQMKEGIAAKFDRIKELDLQMKALDTRKEDIIQGVHRIGKKMLKRNPSAKARLHLEQSLKELKERFVK